MQYEVVLGEFAQGTTSIFWKSIGGPELGFLQVWIYLKNSQGEVGKLLEIFLFDVAKNLFDTSSRSYWS